MGPHLDYCRVDRRRGGEGSEIIPKFYHLALFDCWIQKGL